ncbi:MAG: hypothetical protein WC565_00120 [Parcubacteria group bacterium]
MSWLVRRSRKLAAQLRKTLSFMEDDDYAIFMKDDGTELVVDMQELKNVRTAIARVLIGHDFIFQSHVGRLDSCNADEVCHSVLETVRRWQKGWRPQTKLS